MTHPLQHKLISPQYTSNWLASGDNLCVCVCTKDQTHFSISLFLQVLGMVDVDAELASCLLLSPLLVDGISADTHMQLCYTENTHTWEHTLFSL